jgi:FixJ family two-component response regulator
MPPKVLFVDDEVNVLQAFQRSLRKQFTVDTARSGQEGLQLVSERGPYAVVVSDMRMPSMDGVNFLSRLRALAPDTTRVMLTGTGDVQTAVDAVNRGHVFQFLNKPCGDEELARVLTASVEQYQLIRAERDVLERTLAASIKVLTEVLSLVNPVAFSRALRLRQYVRHMLRALDVQETWAFELAAMLSQLGCVTMASEAVEREQDGASLDPEDAVRLAMHPSVARDLLVGIPRMEKVAEMIARQQDACPEYLSPSPATWDPVLLGAQLLRVALEFDLVIMRGACMDDALGRLRRRPKDFSVPLVAALASYELPSLTHGERRMIIGQLEVGMIIDEDLCNATGLLLVRKGLVISEPLLVRLRLLHRNGQIESHIRVLAPNAS